MKGADAVMSSIVQYNDWLEEEVRVHLLPWQPTEITAVLLIQCGNMAREGLRTLVVGKKILTEEQYTSFEVCVLIHVDCYCPSHRL